MCDFGANGFKTEYHVRPLFLFTQVFINGKYIAKVVQSLTLYDEVDIINLVCHQNFCVNNMFERLAYFNDYKGYFQKTRTSILFLNL